MPLENQIADLVARNQSLFARMEAEADARDGALTNGVWRKISGMPRIAMVGTGTVSFDVRNRAGTEVAARVVYSVTGAASLVKYPFFGADTTQIRPNITGSLEVEII